MKIQAEAGFVIRTERRMSDRVLLGERVQRTHCRTCESDVLQDVHPSDVGAGRGFIIGCI
jgi:hypothetical protein